MTRFRWSGYKRHMLQAFAPPTDERGRHKRRRPHFRTSRVLNMDATADASTQTKREGRQRTNEHEAQMIPGLGPRLYGFPNSIITKMRYCDIILLSGTSGAIANQVFNANGIFDPDNTGTGHQPMWRDQYAAIYDQYVVLGSKITVTAQPATSNTISIFVLQGDDDASNSSAMITRMEQNNSAHHLLGIMNAQTPATLTSTYSPFEVFGVDSKDDGASQVAVGSNPSELWCYQIALQNVDLTTSTSWYISVEIEYTVKFSELQTNAGS